MDLRAEIEKAMERASNNAYDDLVEYGDSAYFNGQMDAYQNVLDMIAPDPLDEAWKEHLRQWRAGSPIGLPPPLTLGNRTRTATWADGHSYEWKITDTLDTEPQK